MLRSGIVRWIPVTYMASGSCPFQPVGGVVCCRHNVILWGRKRGQKKHSQKQRRSKNRQNPSQLASHLFQLGRFSVITKPAFGSLI